MNTSEVHKIIRSYVQTAGGEVSIRDLTSDFKVAYKTHIPFDGFPDLFSFLRTIHGVQLKERDGYYYLVSLKKSPVKPISTSNESEELANICVHMSNNLVIGDSGGKRKVMVNKAMCELTNSRSRRLILNKMNHYSRTSTENATNELKESSNHVYSSNYADYSQNITNPTYPETLPSNIADPTFSEYSSQNTLNSAFTISSSKNTTNSCLSLNDITSLFPEYSSKSSTAYTDESTNSAYGSSSSVTPDGSTFECADNFYTPSYELNTTMNKSTISPNYTDNVYYLLLIDLATKHNLELPRFETSTHLSDGGIFFTTILKVGNENFISPSYASSSSNKTYEELLKNAYESLKRKMNFPNVSYDYDLLAQIIEIINSFKRGVDADSVEIAYIKKYRKAPPLNWINLVENSSSIYTETISNCLFMYPTRSFLTVTPYSNSLPVRVYPNSETWNIRITNVLNTAKIYFQILNEDHNDRYQSLVNKMRQHYFEANVISDVRTVKPSELYACVIEGEWYRVEVLSSQTNDVECLLIDIGTEKTLSIASLFPLDHKFTNTPPLAHCCSMAGLTKYRQVNYISCKLKQMLSNEIASAQVGEMNNEELSLIIFLKNDKVNVNVNQYFSSKIRKELLTPKFDKIGELYDVNVLSVDPSGLVRLQIESDSLYLLKQSLDKAAQKIEKNGNLYVTSLLELDTKKIYLTKIENCWERVMIKKFLNSPNVNIRCIDTGESKTVDIKTIVPTDQLPDTLLHISPQFQEVWMAELDDINEKIVKFMNRFNVRGVKFTVKIVKVDDHVKVEFYKRLSNEQMLPLKNLFLSSNDQISNMDVMNNFNNILPADLCFDLFNSNCDNLANPIPKYQLPNGTCWKVRVVKVINPSNFVLKVENKAIFNELMLDLNNFNIIFSPKPVENVSMGSCYAVKLENRLWYRGLALFVIEESVIIHLLDFGETVSVPRTSVYPILPEFYSLPGQTFNAQLYNIKPSHGEWAPDDCYRFKELVYHKVLNCIVMENSVPVMQVVLLEPCSNNEMKNVSLILFEERRAVSQS